MTKAYRSMAGPITSASVRIIPSALSVSLLLLTLSLRLGFALGMLFLFLAIVSFIRDFGFMRAILKGLRKPDQVRWFDWVGGVMIVVFSLASTIYADGRPTATISALWALLGAVVLFVLICMRRARPSGGYLGR